MADLNGIVGLGNGRAALRVCHGPALLAALAATLAVVPLPAQQEIPPAPAPAVTAPAPNPAAPAPQASSTVKERFLVDHFPDQPSLTPAFTIPIAPLGFTAPGAIYLGARNSMVSLDFLDEDHLLLTFRVPSLMHRDVVKTDDSDERQIRAVILALPQGTAEAEATWTVHDRVRYLWPLNNGHFLLRDRNNLFEGDDTLTLKPYLDFPGSLLSIELDPEQDFLVTNTHEPAAKHAKAGDENPSTETSDLSTSGTATTSDQNSATDGNAADLVIRILRRDSGDVMLVSRSRTAVHLPINSAGYLENLRSNGMQWILKLNYFTGGSRMLGRVESNCEPDDEFLSDQELLSTTCGPSGESTLVAMTTAGKVLWETKAPPTEVWPQTVVAANGARLAWETLDTSHSIYAYAPMDAGDIKEQSVTIFDAANGDIAMVSPVSPILDAGGNVAVSPSGRRVALLNAGSVQVFDLPAPPTVRATGDRP